MNMPGPGDLWSQADHDSYYGYDECDCGECDACIAAEEEAEKGSLCLVCDDEDFEDDWDEV